MHAALMIGLFAVGGWVAPESFDNTPPLFEPLDQPATLFALQLEHPQGDIRKIPETSLNRLGFGPPRSNDDNRGRSSWAQPRNVQTGAAGQPGLLPIEPTDRRPGVGGVGGLPVMPTDRGQGPMVNTGPTPSPLFPTSPTGFTSSPGEGPNGGQPMARPMSNYFLPNLANVPTEKSFPNRTTPTSQNNAAAWQQLYGNRTNNGTIDPYSTYVQPALQQNATNQQFGQAIGAQGSMLEQQQRALQGQQIRGQDVPVGSGLVNPNSFMDYKGYLPAPGQMPSSPYGPP